MRKDACTIYRQILVREALIVDRCSPCPYRPVLRCTSSDKYKATVYVISVVSHPPALPSHGLLLFLRLDRRLYVAYQDATNSVHDLGRDHFHHGPRCRTQACRLKDRTIVQLAMCRDDRAVDTSSLQDLTIEDAIIAKWVRRRVYDKSWRLFLGVCFGNVAQRREFGRSLIRVGDVEADVLAQSRFIEERSIEKPKLALGFAISRNCVGNWAYHNLVTDRYRGLPRGTKNSHGTRQLTYVN
jgi:hypothetical protein